MLSDFPQHCSPFGISIFAQGWPVAKFHHACNMMAQMLDNDQDGCADDATVVENMRLNQAGMGMFEDDNSVNYDLFPDNFRGQDLYASETEPSCSGSDETADCRDAAIEEMFHLISVNGIGPVYPDHFSDCNNDISSLSVMQEQMDIARGGHFTSMPESYPSNAIYHYDDESCEYNCMATEFFYWTLTSMLNGQGKPIFDVCACSILKILNILLTDLSSLQQTLELNGMPMNGKHLLTQPFKVNFLTCTAC